LNIRYLSLTSEPSDSQVLLDCVVLDFPLPTGCRNRCLSQEFKILLFDIGLIPESFGAKVVRDLTADDEIEYQLFWMKSMVQTIQGTGAQMVASQKQIHPYIQDFLISAGIIPLERLSVRHFEAVRLLSGATVISSPFHSIEATQLGLIERMEEKCLDEKLFTFLWSSKSATRLATLVLCAPTNHLCEEVVDLAQRSLRILKHSIHLSKDAPALLPGAGCTEVLLARALRGVVQQLDGTGEDLLSNQRMLLHFKTGISHLAECIEQMAVPAAARDLSSAPSLSVREIVEELYQRNANGDHSWWGWDALKRESLPVLTKSFVNTQLSDSGEDSDDVQPVIEYAPAKLKAITAALETAATMLRIGNALDSSRLV
jgi:chaperonin GroEL (HSP60 family)